MHKNLSQELWLEEITWDT